MESGVSALPAVVFDLDGTLIDSRRDLADSANEMLAGYGAQALEEVAIASMVGSGALTLVKRVMTSPRIVELPAVMRRPSTPAPASAPSRRMSGRPLKIVGEEFAVEPGCV